MTTHADGPRHRRKLRALLVGVGRDESGGPRRVINGEHCLIVGGDEQDHDEMLETVLRLETELERRGQHLGEVTPAELAEIAWRIDSPPLHRLALHLHDELRRRGRAFHDSTPEELTALSLDDPS